MRYGSLCSGIEAATCAWHPLGWTPVFFSEIDKSASRFLSLKYPEVPNYGDMTKFKEWPDVSIDLLCGGTPCQSFSVAGLRKGLDDPRGNLMLTFGSIAAKYRPKWLVWENVPGVLSSNGGRDFGAFLGMLGQLGYGFAYRVLDAQYFGVAQRRRRVFVVGCLGDWRSAAAVLFERHSLQGHPAPSREARQTAPTIPARSTAGGGLGTDFDCDGGLQVAGTMKACKDSGGWSNSADHAAAGYMVPVGTICVATGQAGAEIGADMAPTLNCNHEAPYVAHSLRGEAFDASEDGTGRGTPLVPHVVGALACNTGPNGHDAGNFACNQAVDAGHVLPVAFAENSRHELRLEGGDGQRTGALSTGGGKPGQGVPMIAFPANLSGTQCATTEDLAPSMGATNPTAIAFQERGRSGGPSLEIGGDLAFALTAPNGGGRAQERNVLASMAVRRLTPVECEKLQGFPVGYTNVPHRGKPAADGPRYKALGNSWAVPNVRWIFNRVDLVSSIAKIEKAA